MGEWQQGRGVRVRVEMKGKKTPMEGAEITTATGQSVSLFGWVTGVYLCS